MITTKEKSKFWNYQNSVVMAAWLPAFSTSYWHALFHWDPLIIQGTKIPATAKIYLSRQISSPTDRSATVPNMSSYQEW